MTPEPTIDVEVFKKFERAGYSGVAQGYDRATAAVTPQVNQAVLDAVAAGPGTSLLDVACGPGWLSAAAALAFAIVSAGGLSICGEPMDVTVSPLPYVALLLVLGRILLLRTSTTPNSEVRGV